MVLFICVFSLLTYGKSDLFSELCGDIVFTGGVYRYYYMYVYTHTPHESYNVNKVILFFST